MGGVPPEIVEFFRAFPGQSLLIRGLPGTGKTILAFEILGEICEKRNGLYISTRVEPSRLYMTSPWIRDFIPERNIIDATQDKLKRSLGLGVGGRSGEGLVFDYGTVLEFFRAVYEDAEDMENPVIIFDSWDGVLSHLNIEREAPALTQEICDFCREMEIHTIFVAERDAPAVIDYIVDGVITLRCPWMSDIRAISEASERLRVREIEINKLRGLPISRPKYLFTLHNGRFKYFPPFIEDLTARAEPIPDPDEEHISTGIKDLDDLIGGFRVGSFNLWEIGRGVNKRYDQMLLQMCMNMIGRGGGVIGIPPMGSSIMKVSIKNLLIHQPETDDVNVEISSLLTVVRRIHDKTGKPAFCFISIDTLENIFGEGNTIKFLENIAKISKETQLISSILYLMRSEAKISKLITQAADTYMVLMDIDGALTIYGVRPATGLYGITSDVGGIHLTPIV